MVGNRLDAALRDLWEEARDSWPGVEVECDRFAEHVLRHASEADAAGLARLRSSDLYLACGCLSGDAAAMRAFEAQVMPAVDNAVRRLDASPEFVEEVKQRLREKLFVAGAGQAPKIADYAGRGPLVTWVRVSAVRTALNLKGSAHREVQMSDEQMAALAPSADDPELEVLKERYAAEFEAALRSACAQLSGRQRSVLRLRLADGLSIDQIGDIYGVHRATVARWIAAAREQALASTRRELEAALRLSDSEFDSLVRVVQSRIDLSISQFLRKTED